MNRIKLAFAISALLISNITLADLNTGLVAYYSFDDCTAKDSSINHFDGTIQGNPQCTSGVTLNGSTGKALQFNGSTDWIEGNIDSNVFAKDWSIATWIYHTGYGELWESVFSNSTNGVNNAPVMTFKGDTSQRNYLGINGVGTTPNGTFVNLGSHFNQWIFAVITYKSGIPTVYAYKNGKLIKFSQTLSWNLQTSNGFYIGRHYYDLSNQLFNGKIDEVKIYNRALSSSEIDSLYNQNVDITGLMKGFISAGFNVQCQNITTGEIATASTTNFNCESSGLSVKSKDSIKITIEGKAK